jgi:regulator of sigma E protease
VTIIITIALGIIVLGILVFIHELGHFLVAKWCGIRVLVFSLGFGSTIIKRQVGDTEYRISSIPFGGYVKMAGENPEEKAGAADEFPSRPIWQRALVAIAGPAANYLSALLMLWIVYIWGIEKPLYYERPIVGAVSDSSAAQSAGINAGDSLVNINGKPITSWDQVENMFAQQNRKYQITYYREGEQHQADMVMPKDGSAIPKQPMGGLLPPLPAVVADVNKNSPASAAGFQAGDTILSIDGAPVISWFQVTKAIEKYSSENPMSILVSRGGNKVTLSVKPKYDSVAKRKIVGIKVSEGKSKTVRYNPAVAFRKGIDKGWEYTTMIFDVIGKLASREVSANQLAGPVGIIPASGFIALQGVSPILNFMALIGINLAVLNLLPLVITDGGLLFFLLLEAIRRKPLSVKTQATINKIAVMFFLFLFLFVTLNDIRRLPEYFRMFGK